jgi:hypothetical protein
MFQRRSEELETYLFLYDFRELKEAAKLVISYQRRIRELQASIAQLEASSSIGDQGSSLTELRAQVFIASEDLDVVFEAIKLAQEKSHGQRHDQKLAVRLLATSSEITWQMTDNRAELLAKLSVKDVGFSWLSRQDSSTVNKLVIRDLQAFDGAPGAIWPEILSKHKEPASHPLVKVSNLGQLNVAKLSFRKEYSRSQTGASCRPLAAYPYMSPLNSTSTPFGYRSRQA